MTRINAIKKLIYDRINTTVTSASGFLAYSYQDQLLAKKAIYVVYQLYNISDVDTMLNERDEVGISINIHVSTVNKKSRTSIEADTLLQQIKDRLKLFEGSTTQAGITYALSCSLPTLIVPAQYNEQKEEYIAAIRFNAIITIST